MSSAARIVASPSNPQFSATGFIRPDEREIFDEFQAAHMAELSPQSPVEQTLAREIVHAAWRLRRCAASESGIPGDATGDDLDRIQLSVDRARATAQRVFHRSLAELRRVQTERVYRDMALPGAPDPENLGLADSRRIDPPALLIKRAAAEDALLTQELAADYKAAVSGANFDSAKQTQSQPAAVAPVPRNAQCPCASRENHVRSGAGQALSPQAVTSS